jgi:membrane-bound serine protease (ClpP class)
MRRWILLFAATLAFATECLHATSQVGLIKIDGAIGPGTSQYISRACEVSAARGDQCLIIQLDTPGGVLNSTIEIVQTFYNSKVPTVVYVAPAPAIAGSAGVFITMAADVAAMAPHTSIGAAHPVNIGMSGGVEKVDDTMKTKMENAYGTMIETIAEKRHRNSEWAKAAVKESVVITSEVALRSNVVDLIAVDIPDLLNQIDGRKVGEKTLKTADAQVAEIPMTTREKFVLIFLRPEMMFVLMLIVMYGIMGELSNPGVILPGVAGAIALVLVLYMSSVLPVNWAGMALIGLAIAFFIADIYATTHGALTTGGIVSFFLGALLLFDRNDPAFRLSLGLIIPATIVTTLFFVFVVGAGLRAQMLPARTGTQTMIGQVVPALTRIDATSGKVFIEGETWNAVSETAVEKDQPVEIAGIEGLTLKVKPKT